MIGDEDHGLVWACYKLSGSAEQEGAFGECGGGSGFAEGFVEDFEPIFALGESGLGREGDFGLGGHDDGLIGAHAWEDGLGLLNALRAPR